MEPRKLNVIELAALKGVEAEVRRLQDEASRAQTAANVATANGRAVMEAMGLDVSKPYKIDGDMLLEIEQPKPVPVVSEAKQYDPVTNTVETWRPAAGGEPVEANGQ